MSDNEQDLHQPTEPDSIVAKPKRVMTQKQLDNLAKARKKANIVLAEKRERRATLKANEKKLKEMKLKEREDRIQAEMNNIKAVNLNGEPDGSPVQYVRKSKKKKKEPKVVYYSSSSEDDSEPEIVYQKKPKKKPPAPKPPTTAPAPHTPQAAPEPHVNFDPNAVHEEEIRRREQAAVEQQYQAKLKQMRKEALLRAVFPMG